MIDPRFPGGTSSSFAAELPIATAHFQVTVHACTQSMFGDRAANSSVLRALSAAALPMHEKSAKVAADFVVIHNPALLKFSSQLDQKIICRHLIVVAHENFLGPNGHQSFDVANCLEHIDRASIALTKCIAPVSEWNRGTILRWLGKNPGFKHWQVTDNNWFNICDFEFVPPNEAPRDKRGRLSRPGLEKFPPLDVMDACFPKHSELNLILGADALAKASSGRRHWTLKPFGSMDVAQFYRQIDFMIYFVAPTLRESFGRVIAEAISAGKVVITDPDNGSVFGGHAITADPREVDGIVENFVENPRHYVKQVEDAQVFLTQNYSAEMFGQFLVQTTHQLEGRL